MPHDPEVATFRVGCIPVSVITMAGLVASVARYLERGPDEPGAFVAFRDAHGVVRSEDDPRLRAAHEAARLVVPDGRPLVWVGRARGCGPIGQVPGIEAVETLCRAGAAAGWRHYFLGGGPGVAAALAATMSARVPNLRVAGHETPPFRPLDLDEVALMRERIRASGAQVIWIGLGAPKQELFMAEHAPFLPGTIAMGVGAAFDVNTGRIPRAPRALQAAGLEWMYRLLREPRRLWPRYAVVVPRFLAILAADLAARAGSPMRAWRV